MAPEPKQLEVVPVWSVSAGEEGGARWLVDRLWGEEAVGVIGGAPKCTKSWLSLEMALAVASGVPCLGVFHIERPGPVLVLAAEDSPRQVRERMEGLAKVRGVRFGALDVNLIVETRLQLQHPIDQNRVAAVLERYRPRLLVLDPFIRLHSVDENSASEISGVLATLRQWQRMFRVAILVVHHTRKVNGGSPGQALRGSSDFHAWGDSNLYLKRKEEEIVLTMEHRSAASGTPVRLRLAADDVPPHLEVIGDTADEQKGDRADDLPQRIFAFVARSETPPTQEAIRTALSVRNQTLTVTLQDLQKQGRLIRHQGRWGMPRIEESVF
jgi:hypothetical protein